MNYYDYLDFVESDDSITNRLEFNSIADACNFLICQGYLGNDYKNGLVNIDQYGNQFIKIIVKKHDFSIELETDAHCEHVFTIAENGNEVNIVCNGYILTSKHCV